MVGASGGPTFSVAPSLCNTLPVACGDDSSREFVVFSFLFLCFVSSPALILPPSGGRHAALMVSRWFAAAAIHILF